MAASMQRLDTSNLSNPDGGLHNGGGLPHRTSGASLDKSHSFRESHEPGRGAASAGPSSSHGELQPLTSVLFLEPITLIDAKSNRQVELRRAMNAATGQQSDDPSLGSMQSKALENCSPEEIKRVRSTLSDNVLRARERSRHFSEATIKLDRFQNALQSRKRNKADSGAHDRGSNPGPGPRGAAASGQTTTKVGSRSVPSSGEASKGGEKSKSGIINKRMRTSLADARPEGRAINWIVQRSSGVQERERDTTRPSGILSSSVDSTEKTSVIGSAGWEKAKMKGRRSATLKAEAFGLGSVNGCVDGDREQKGNVQHHRAGGDSRSRPSEGHGFRSGLVHGTTYVQKGDHAVQVNGSSVRGSSKIELEGTSYAAGKLERVDMTERGRLNGKPGAKPISRVEGLQASPGITPKAKGARAPRSNSVAGGNQTGHMSRSSSFTEVREKPSVITPPKPQVSSGLVNKKRPASSRSSSPPVASWGSSRHQKMARARRVNPMPPVGIFVPTKEEANGAGEGDPPLLDGSASAVTASARLNPPVTSGGSNLAKRLSGGHGVPPSKAQTERLFISVGPVESDDCTDEGHKIKDRNLKHEVVVGKHKMSDMIQKLGTVVVPTRKEMVLAQEESGGGDGVRRQGRTGRGSVTPRVVAVSSPSGKVEVSPVNTKPTRSARATVESKPAGPGRPVTKKVVSDRKSVGRPRRLLSNSVAVLSGEEDDDRQRLSEAVQQAVDFSAAACSGTFWRQVEAHFAPVTSDDISFLHKEMARAGDSNTAIHSHLDTVVKSTCLRGTVTEKDEGKSLKNLREQTEIKPNFMRGKSGGLHDRVFPLSQLLLSALISERVGKDCQMVSDETCVDRDSDSPLPPSSHSEIDYDRRDAEGESDVDNGGYSECSPFTGDQGNPLWSDDRDEDVILADKDIHQLGRADWVNGVRDCVKDDQPGSGSQMGISSLDWEEQYQKMSLDDRLQLELSSVGLLPVQPRHLNELDEDEISEETRRLQNDHTNQVSWLKEQLCKLQSAVLESREAEERAREKLAMDKFVELAYKKKTGGRFTKGAAGKAAKAASDDFSKRVLARVRDFEAGHSCITEPALRDKLFCVPPSVVESIAIADSNGAKEDSLERSFERMNSDCTGSIDFSHLKEEARERAEEREIFLEDVSGYTTTRDVNTLSSNGFGGIKGKRSERDRDGKVKDGGAPARSGQGNAKGERKNKTKPRQKTGSLLRSMQGPVPNATDSHQLGKGSRASIQANAAAERHSNVRRDEAAMPSLPGFLEQQGGVEGPFDLSTIPLPGMEDMSMTQTDVGSWLDFDLEDPMQQTDDFLNMGLDVPMDDLSGLNMMM